MDARHEAMAIDQIRRARLSNADGIKANHEVAPDSEPLNNRAVSTHRGKAQQFPSLAARSQWWLPVPAECCRRRRASRSELVNLIQASSSSPRSIDNASSDA